VKKGNPNPSPETRFKPGQSGNPGGKTSAQRDLEIANAERATRIRARMLEALEGVMNEHPEKDKIIDNLVRADILRLVKEAEDRGLGTPKQSLDVESPNGTMTPKPGIDLSKAPPELLEWIVAQNDATEQD
jgi:hypothetical protein